MLHLIRLEPLTKATKGDTVAGHKYLTRKPDGRGGWHYVYSHATGEDHPHAREAAAHSQALAHARKELDEASDKRLSAWESSGKVFYQRKVDPALDEAMHAALEKVTKHRDAMRASEKEAGIKPEKLRTVDVHVMISDGKGGVMRDPEPTSMQAIGDYGIVRGKFNLYSVTHIPSGYSINAGGALEGKAEAEHFVREMAHVAPLKAEIGGASIHAASYANAAAKRLAAEEKKKSESEVDDVDPLFKAGKGETVAGHKYLTRTPDGKGGWKYSYKPPEEHKPKGDDFDPATLKSAIEEAAVRGESALFLMPHEGKVYVAHAVGRYTSKEIAIAGHELVGVLPENTDFKTPLSYRWGDKTAPYGRGAGSKLRAHVTEKPTTLAVVPPPAAKKKKDAVAVWDSGQWKYVGEHMAARYEQFHRIGKSAPLLIVPLVKASMPPERPGHKYVRRTPDGVGGWRYIYTEDSPRPRPRGKATPAQDDDVTAKLQLAKKNSVEMGRLIKEGKLQGSLAGHVQIARALLAKHADSMPAFKEALAKAAPEGAKVKARTKEIHSVIGKIVEKTKQGKARYSSAHGLQDMTGARIVCKSVQDVKSTVENLKKSFTVIEGDDYVDKPKDGDKGLGYRSHHLILKDKDGLEKEVQIRTPFQDRHGDWCHDVYKPVNEAQEKVLAESADEIADYARRISDYYFAIESGKTDVEPVQCPDSVKNTFGCLK